MQDLQALPKVRDSWSWPFVEHCRIDQDDKVIAVHDARGRVYAVADLYKTGLTIPVAFDVVAAGAAEVESRARRRCRDIFQERRLLARIVPDIERALGVPCAEDSFFDGADAAIPGGLWDSEGGSVSGGVNHGSDVDEDVP